MKLLDLAVEDKLVSASYLGKCMVREVGDDWGTTRQSIERKHETRMGLEKLWV